MRKRVRGLFALVLCTGLFGIFLLAEDRRYERYKFTGIPDTPARFALVLTWGETRSTEFWSDYAQKVHPGLVALYDAGLVELTLPFAHEPLKHPERPAQWSHTVLVLLAESVEGEGAAKAIIKDIAELAERSPLSAPLQSIDLLRLQEGLDLFYPVKRGLEREPKLRQTLEFVFSEPAHRAGYYADQRVWSGPAMADLHSRDKVGRFVGFEVLERLYGAPDMPAWDLVHLYGFTRWQMIKSIPFFLPTWNRHARRAFGQDSSFAKKLAEWDSIRLNLDISGSQHMPMTLVRAASQNPELAPRDAKLKGLRHTVALDHVVLKTTDLERSVEAFRASGFTVVYGGMSADESHNAMIYLADESFIELIEPNRFPFIFRLFLKSGLGRFFGSSFQRFATFFDEQKGDDVVDLALTSDRFDDFHRSVQDRASNLLSSTRVDSAGVKLSFTLFSPNDVFFPFVIDTYEPHRMPTDSVNVHPNGAVNIRSIELRTNRPLGDIERFYRDFYAVSETYVREDGALVVPLTNVQLVYDSTTPTRSATTVTINVPGDGYGSPHPQLHFVP